MAEPLEPRDIHVVHRERYLGGGPWIAIASVVVVAVVILVWVLTQPNPTTVTVVQTPGPTRSVLGTQQVQIYQTAPPPLPQATRVIPGPTVRETNYVPGPTVTKTVAPPTPLPVPGAYNAQGTVVGVDPAHGRITVRIEAVPELNLAASTRTFRVRDGSDLSMLQPGDDVSFVIDYQTGGTMTAEQIATMP